MIFSTFKILRCPEKQSSSQSKVVALPMSILGSRVMIMQSQTFLVLLRNIFTGNAKQTRSQTKEMNPISFYKADSSLPGPRVVFWRNKETFTKLRLL